MEETENTGVNEIKSRIKYDAEDFLDKIDSLVENYYYQGTVAQIKGKTIPKGESAQDLVENFFEKNSDEAGLYYLLDQVENHFYPDPSVKENITPPSGYALAAGAIMNRLLAMDKISQK